MALSQNSRRLTTSSGDNAVRSTSDWYMVRRSHATLAARFTGTLVNNETTARETNAWSVLQWRRQNLLSSLHARGTYVPTRGTGWTPGASRGHRCVSSQRRLSAGGGSLVCGSSVIHTEVGPFLPSFSDGSRVVQGWHLPS